MPAPAAPTLDSLDTPQLLIDLDVVDANVRRMRAALRERSVALRVHFKSLKCTGLARHLADSGVDRFLTAKLSEAEVLADAGFTDLVIANQVVGVGKLRRLVDLARRVGVTVCVDDADNVRDLDRAARAERVRFGALVEVDIGMGRCGVEPGEPALALARLVQSCPGLHFVGLQGYQGHLQMIADGDTRRARCLEGLQALHATRRLVEEAGIPVAVVTGGGTGTWDDVGLHPVFTELQPGSFVLMDAAYHQVRPEFGCALSILCTVLSRRPKWYVLDAGSKAISQDFGTPQVKGRAQDRVVKLAEEHTKVETADAAVRLGDRFEVLPAHCCATMNLHRQAIAVRQGRVEAVWPIEASGRYD